MITEEPKNLNVTPIADIKKNAREVIEIGKLVELPSGMVFRLARPSLAIMLKEGRIPGNLASAAVKQMQGQSSLSQAELKESIEVVELIVMEAVKEPRVVAENPDENSISIKDLTDDDKGFIFQFVQSGATDLTKFRPEQ